MTQRILVCALAFVLVGLLAASPADAGFKRLGASGLAFLKVAQGARPAAMGDAFTAVADDINAMFWNPAGLVYIPNREIVFSYNRWVVDSKFYSGAFAISTDRGTFGISFVQFTPQTIEETTPFAPAGTGRKLAAGDMAIGFAYAKKLTDRFSLGGHFRYIQETLDKDKISTVDVNLGTLFYTGFRSSRIAMTIRNFGKNESVYNVSERREGETFLAPMVFTTTIAMEFYGKKQDPNHLTVSFENVFAIDYDNRAHLGAELWLANTLALRGGYKFNYDTDGFSGGVGIKREAGKRKITVDFAYTDMGKQLEPALRFSVGGSF
ncbi:PorV/PorQ family protein [bacterium]|nr:PorV/PorQ family protein [bacterium]